MERQRKLFEAGITSRDSYDSAQQAFQNSKADYASAVATTATQKRELGYYRIVAPFTGVVGDVPVHVGDYVSSTTLLTTIDANTDLEAYIYVPDRAGSRAAAGAAGEHSGPGRHGAGDDEGGLPVAAGGRRAAGHFAEGAGEVVDGRPAVGPSSW